MNLSISKEIHFIEIQKFNQRLLWVLLLGSSTFVVIFFGYGMIKQLVLGQLWGNRPMSDLALSIVGPIIMIFMVGITYLFYSLKLITEVRKDGLYIKFFPLSHRIIPFKNIIHCEAKTYRPIKEYGGWGIRFGRKGKAYNVSGNRGVQLELSDGKLLLVGSQRHEELALTINKIINID